MPEAPRGVSRRRLEWRYSIARLVIGLLMGGYLRLRLERRERLPPAPYLLCFNHLGWLDPFVIVVLWPARPRVHVFGPREEDMNVGARNRVINWIGTAVPFRPTKDDLVRSTRRSMAILAEGHVLAIAGEGRLSEEETVVLPINEGAAFLALRARVPIVPLAINGTRWLRFGKVIRLRVGEPIPTAGLRPGRETLDRLTGEIHRQLSALVADYPDRRVPGPVGRWLTEVFSERPWLATDPATEAATEAATEPSDDGDRTGGG